MTRPATKTTNDEATSAAAWVRAARMLRSVVCSASTRAASPLATMAAPATATTTVPSTGTGWINRTTLSATTATVTAARAAALTRAASTVPRWLPKDRESLRGRRAQRTARRASTNEAASAKLCPASARRPDEWAATPPTTCPSTRARLTARATANRDVRVTGGATSARWRPQGRRPLTQADLFGQVGLDQGQVVGVGHADAAAFGGHHGERGGRVGGSRLGHQVAHHLG